MFVYLQGVAVPVTAAGSLKESLTLLQVALSDQDDHNRWPSAMVTDHLYRDCGKLYYSYACYIY